MIRPDDIHRKAVNFYDEWLRAWLSGDAAYFPRTVRANLKPDRGDVVGAAEAVRRLRTGSKEERGTGYTVEWDDVNSRAFGRNQLPVRVFFATEADYLDFIGKSDEFAAFVRAVQCIRAATDELELWLQANASRVTELAPDLDGLLSIVRFLRDHPRPQLFARELPVAADTKLVERHQGLLREWLDSLLPPHTIRADEDHFERRYGLRYVEPHLHVRLLDNALGPELGFPCREFALPLGTLAALPLSNADVYIVENKVNLWTLPALRRGLGLGGLGHGVTLLRYCPWLKRLPIVYWGDLDVEGFEILSSLRSTFPQARSAFMDEATFNEWQHLANRGMGRRPDVPPHLTETEGVTYRRCRDQNLRLEQERIPQAFVLAALVRSTVGM